MRITGALVRAASFLLLYGTGALVLGQTPSITAIVNAASYAGGSVSPGEIVTIFGSGIGPANLAGLQLNSAGLVSSQLSGTQVSFGGFAAPLIYASATQTSAIVPYEVAALPSTQVRVTYNGVLSAQFTVTIAPSAPGIFTANSSGNGQGAILNQNGSVNSAANPAAPGSVISIFGTGEGTSYAYVPDGAIMTSVVHPGLPVSVLIGGVTASVTYSGSAPDSVAGFFQVNATIPANAGSGNLPVLLKVGTVTSAPSVTVSVAGSNPVITMRTVILVHGIGESSTDMNGLAASLNNATYGINTSRYRVDSGFDYSSCTQMWGPWPSNCSIENGATELANYINANVPTGDIVIVGYSLGGLLARDMILNNRSGVLSGNRRVIGLATMGTPNVGFPGALIDELIFNPTLITEMTSDYITDEAQDKVLESPYLFGLNNSWSNAGFPFGPQQWFVISGVYCPKNPGCPNYAPYGDGLVCDESARVELAIGNKPIYSAPYSGYAHTDNPSFSLLATATSCPPVPAGGGLNNPAMTGPVIQDLRNFINALP